MVNLYRPTKSRKRSPYDVSWEATYQLVVEVALNGSPDKVYMDMLPNLVLYLLNDIKSSNSYTAIVRDGQCITYHATK